MMPMSETSKVTIRRREGSAARAAGAVEPKRVQAEIEALERLDLGALRIQWRNRWGRLAPPSLPRGLLNRVMAYRLQAETFGDLNHETVRLLDRLAKEAPAARSETNTSNNVGPDNVGPGNVGPPLGAIPGEPNRRGVGRPPARNDVGVPMILKPGALLTREWQGRIERVMALERGFAWNGQTFASLSGVAFAITGVKWSGQRFFFGSAGRSGTGLAAKQPEAARRGEAAIIGASRTSLTPRRFGALTSGGPPSPSAATSSHRPNWRRNGKIQKSNGSQELGR
jgi:hypothetical protein